ncbi:unnamed protein product [Arctia plantaginis]|uniref:Uncharacterized protein n=1 Tax=Arctia plantaginis TaxID=874455 RepID=A0A8S0Z4M4_ARCPL|nr:unnamed protein product [Arctia plantaginis]
MLGLSAAGQLSPHRREVFCEGLFLVLKLSPHMGGGHGSCTCGPPYVRDGRIVAASSRAGVTARERAAPTPLDDRSS